MLAVLLVLVVVALEVGVVLLPLLLMVLWLASSDHSADSAQSV